MSAKCQNRKSVLGRFDDRGELPEVHSSAQYSHRFAMSDANALRTSDCEIPNCRAILDGVTPALKVRNFEGMSHPLRASISEQKYLRHVWRALTRIVGG